MKDQSDWTTRAAAIEMLGVRPQTLYAYVSRGIIRAKPEDRDPRRSRYSVHDIRELVARKKHARRRRDIAAGAIAWGEAVLETAISTVRDHRLVFRGQDAVLVSQHASLEDVAQLLWRSCPPPPGANGRARISRLPTPKARGFDFLSQAAGVDPPSFGRTQSLLHREAWEILQGFTDAMLGKAAPGLIHERIAAVWALDSRASDIFRRALVLASDHELNASTFAARIAVSTGAPLAAAALAGFAAVVGPLHGLASARALDLLDRMLASDAPHQFIRDALSRGERIFAFGHPLYSSGDVRAAELLRALKPSRRIRDAIRAGEKETGQAAMLDMAFAAMTRELGLGGDAGFIIFAIGRMVGWIAHALEQHERGRLIRPRARYIGP